MVLVCVCVCAKESFFSCMFVCVLCVVIDRRRMKEGEVEKKPVIHCNCSVLIFFAHNVTCNRV